MFQNLARALAVSVIMSVSAPVGAVTLDVLFDDVASDGVQPDNSVVGSGTLSFDDPGGTGSFDFFGLTGLSLFFEFDSGPSFTEADIVTTTDTDVLLSGAPGNRELVFSGIGNGGMAGSLDLINADGAGLSFGPTEFEGLFQLGLVQQDGQQQEFLLGDYQASESPSPIPLPGGLALLLSGLAGLGLVTRRAGYRPA